MANLRKNEAYWSDKDERWHIYVQANGVRRHFVSTVGVSSRKGKLQAERKADKWLEEQLSDENQKVEVLYDKWIESLKERTQTAYWTQYEGYGRCWIKPAIGSKRMSKLTEADLDRILAAAYQHGLARKTLQNIRSCLSAFLKYARKCKATTLVADDIIIPRNAPVGKKECLTPDEVSTVFTSDETTFRGITRPDFYINLYRFLLFEGLRPGEALGLKWADIDEDGYEIKRAYNAQSEITQGKNDNARRRHSLSAYSRELLDAQKKLLREYGILSPFVFPRKDGTPTKQRAALKAWERYCEHNKINHISLYELRHTNYSLNKAMPEAYKKMLFGHSAKFNGDAVYDHEIAGDLEYAAKMNEAAFLKIIKKA